MINGCTDRSKVKTLFIGLFALFSVEVCSEPVQIETSFETRYSDNMTKTKSKESDTEYTLGLGFLKEEHVGKLDFYADADLRYKFYQDETYDNELEADLVINGDYHFVPQVFLWNVRNDLNEVTIDTRLADTPDNRERKNIFSTGPRYTLMLNQLNNLRFKADYLRTDYQTEGTDSDRYVLNNSFNHTYNEFITLSIVSDWSKVRYAGDNNLYRLENSLAANGHYAHYTTTASVGNTTIKERGSIAPDDRTELITWDFSVNREINSDSTIQLSFSRELNDTSSDLDVRNDNSDLNYTQEGVVRVTEWSVRYSKRFANSSTGSFRVYQNESRYKVNLSTEENIGSELSYQYPLSSFWSVNSRLSYENSKFDTSSLENDLYELSLGASYAAMKNVQLSFDTGYEETQSNFAAREYEELWVSFSITYQPNI